MEKLPKKFKKLWLEALRSGKFKQGKLRLHNLDDNSYCCLGIACRIMHPRRVFNGVDLPYKSHKFKIPKMLNCDQSNSIAQQLAEFNDDKGYSFEKIANWIEKNI